MEVINNLQNASSFWENLSGSFLGTITALIIFFLESRREKKKIKNEKRENYRNALIYFKLLLESIVINAHKQINAYEIHAAKIKENPLEFNILQLFITQDVDRILNKFDQERLFQAYLQEFGNHVDVIKEFKNIISILDYFNSVYNQVAKSQETYLNDLNDNLLAYKDITEEEVLKNCVRIINDIRRNNVQYIKDQLYIAFNDIVSNYHKTSPNPPTIEHIQKSLISPITEYVINNFKAVPDAFDIADECRRATWLYNDIIFKATTIASEFNNYHKGMAEVLAKLEGYRRILDFQVAEPAS
jgi:hypothetical protein